MMEFEAVRSITKGSGAIRTLTKWSGSLKDHKEGSRRSGATFYH